LLIVAIVCQSFGAVASAWDSHQTDSQHLQTQHSHADDKRATTADQHEIEDCHHCGHCSGSHLTWVNVEVYISQQQLIAQEVYQQQVTSLSRLTETALRPPIV